MERSTGGKGGGKALLTEKGKKINALFKELEKETEVFCRERLEKLEVEFGKEMVE